MNEKDHAERDSASTGRTTSATPGASMQDSLHTVTFYSFKGGVGRTLALLNVATLLAQHGNRVAIADFDLEAPGLDTYDGFQPRRRAQPGVLEFITDYLSSPRLVAPSCRKYLYCVFDNGEHRKIDGNRGPRQRSAAPFQAEGNGALYVMRAGRQDAAYCRNLARLNWDKLFLEQQGHLLFANLKNELFDSYGCNFLLLDSRTGLNDVAGVCTAFLPDAVVLLFYPDSQNERGVERVALAIRDYGERQGRHIPRMYCVGRVPHHGREELQAASRVRRMHDAIESDIVLPLEDKEVDESIRSWIRRRQAQDRPAKKAHTCSPTTDGEAELPHDLPMVSPDKRAGNSIDELAELSTHEASELLQELRDWTDTSGVSWIPEAARRRYVRSDRRGVRAAVEREVRMQLLGEKYYERCFEYEKPCWSLQAYRGGVGNQGDWLPRVVLEKGFVSFDDMEPAWWPVEEGGTFGGAAVCEIPEHSSPVSKLPVLRYEEESTDFSGYEAIAAFAAANNLFERLQLWFTIQNWIECDDAGPSAWRFGRVQGELNGNRELFERQFDYARKWHPDIKRWQCPSAPPQAED